MDDDATATGFRPTVLALRRSVRTGRPFRMAAGAVDSARKLAWQWRANSLRATAARDCPDFWALPDHAGIPYALALTRLHAQLQPRRYLEIGTRGGTSLKLANCASIAIDPAFQFQDFPAGTLNKPACLLFQETSDAFFENHNPSALLNGPLDMAFLDGMHLYEFVLRDFINAERHCQPNAVILLHDSVPTDAHVARRDEADRTLAAYSPHPNWWAGDVWKAALIIRRLRPDLRVHAFDAPPTGLVAITNLDPGSDVLARAYSDVVTECRDLTLGAFGPDAYQRAMGLRRFTGQADEIAGLFGPAAEQ